MQLQQGIDILLPIVASIILELIYRHVPDSADRKAIAFLFCIGAGIVLGYPDLLKGNYVNVAQSIILFIGANQGFYQLILDNSVLQTYLRGQNKPA